MSAWDASGAPVVRWECPCGSVIESRGKMLLAWAITDHETRDHAAASGNGGAMRARLPKRLDRGMVSEMDATFYYGVSENVTEVSMSEAAQCLLDWDADGNLLGIEVVLSDADAKRVGGAS